MNKTRVIVAALFASTAAFSTAASADCTTLLTTLKSGATLSATNKAKLKNFAALQTAVVTAAKASTGGYGLPMWATLMDETGAVCAIVTSPGAQAADNSFTSWGNLETTANNGKAWAVTLTDQVTKKAADVGTNADSNGGSNVQWLGSRVISAQKANTANAFSVNGYSIASGNLYSAVLENGSLYGLQHSNPVNASITYGKKGTKGSTFGTDKDPMIGERPGGVNVFGGGLALYKTGGVKVGSVGVSGDTSCRDHAFAWEVRNALGLANNTGGITTANSGQDANNTYGTKVTALTGASKGDELIIDARGGLAGVTEVADVDSGAVTDYWTTAWSHPACPNVVTHSSTIFVDGNL